MLLVPRAFRHTLYIGVVHAFSCKMEKKSPMSCRRNPDDPADLVYKDVHGVRRSLGD